MKTTIKVKSVSAFLSSATTEGVCPVCDKKGYVLRARDSNPYFWCHGCKRIIRDVELSEVTE